MSIMLRSENVSFRLVPASALIAIAAVCWSPVASAGPLTDYLTGIGVNPTADIGNPDRAINYWTPTTAGVAREIVDYSGNNNGGVRLRTGAGYGGQPYDLEALYVQKVGNDLKITGVAGAPPSQRPTAACAGSGICALPSGTPSTYGMGDFFLGSLSGTTFSPKVGVETTGQWFSMNSSGHSTGYTTPLAAGALASLSGSVNNANGTVVGTDAANGWERGLTNWGNVPAPSQIAASVTSSIGSATMAYETLGGSHYIYQATITNFAALGLGSDLTVHWGEICGNDWLRTTTADVPLPSSLALFLLGGAGLAAGTRRRKV
jgi:hypothetical protein